MARLLVVISGGMVETIAAEGLPDDLDLELVTIDYDTDGADPEEDPNVLNIDGELAFVGVSTVDTMTPDQAAKARMARDTWRLT